MAQSRGKAEETSNPTSFAAEIGEVLSGAARVETIYGDPIVQGDITVVPVAKARWGFGGGRGLRPSANGGAREGMGGGGGLRVDPVGIVVIRGDEAEFRPIKTEPRWSLLLGLAALGFVIGRL